MEGGRGTDGGDGRGGSRDPVVEGGCYPEYLTFYLREDGCQRREIENGVYP